MNEQANGQLQAPAQSQVDGGADRSGGFGQAPRFTVDKSSGKTAGQKNEAVLGPFTIRDLTVFGSTLILFVASLIPMFADRYNLWNLGSLFFLGLGIALPVIVAALFVARRLSPETKIRIGSLSVDQFGSVVASFAVAFFFLAVAGAYDPSMLLALAGAIGLHAATVLGRLIPFFAGDFLDRAEVPAHIAAREAAVPVRKPRAPKAPKEAKYETAPKTAGAGAGAGASAVAGWAKRLTGGGKSDAARGAAGDSADGAAARPAAVTPVPVHAEPAPGASAHGASVHGSSAQGASAPGAQAQAARPAASAGAPETQVAATVPAATSPRAASAAEQTQAAAVVGSGTQSSVPSASEAPEAQARAAAAAEETRAAEVPAAANHSAPTTVNPQVRQAEPIGATVDPASRPEDHDVRPVQEAFWFAVAQPRTAVDEHSGAPAFVIEPGGWVLALEDRGHEFLVQHTDGRVGVLRDLSNIERG